MPTSAICRNSSFSVFPAGSRSGYSLGADSTEGGEGVDADVGYLPKQ